MTDMKQLHDGIKKAKEFFSTYSPSVKKAYLKWLFTAKRPETRLKRIKKIIEAAAKGEKLWGFI